jgi:hypothetical protein
VRRIFGHHGLRIDNVEHLAGRFNSHLRRTCLLFADEAIAVSLQQEGVLKGLITEPTLAIEAKGVDVVPAENHLGVIMASNRKWLVPAGADSRRFVVCHVSDARRGDRAYFRALFEQLDKGGLAAMLHDLLNLDLGDWHPEADRVETAALTDQRIASLRGFERVWFDVLRAGELPTGHEELGGTRPFVGTRELREWAAQRMQRRDLNDGDVSGLLEELGGKRARPRSSPGTRGSRGYYLPTLGEMRAAWDERRFPVEWDDDDETSWSRAGVGGPF